MKISKLLNKNYLSILFCFLFLQNTELFSNEPVDIWNIDKKNIDNVSIKKKEKKDSSLNSIYEMQTPKKDELKIELEETLLSKKIQIAGIYDPAENGLSIDMWTNSDGKKIKNILSKINKKELSEDAKEILNISILTNSYFPQKNISDDEFLKIKLDWLLQNGDLKLIEEYLLKNQNIDKNLELIKFLLDDYLSQSEVEKACNVFDIVQEGISDHYLSKYEIYCLINKNKKEEAQLLFDLKKELGFNDSFFEEKFDFLMGYIPEVQKKISEKSILDFHLSHSTISDFNFEPNELTSKIIWRYLSSSNLLESIDNVDLEDLKKISMIEKATHEYNYKEEDLFNLYKRFKFSINQLLTVKESYKLLSNEESRALVYQGVLITTEIDSKLELIKILKSLFEEDKINNAFKYELSNILNEIDEEDVPSNHTNFYKEFVGGEKTILTKIKFNNKIIHQSKLLNYFRKDAPNNVDKDLNDLLKKAKKNKKYYFSTKDIILLESLKSDGVSFSEEFNNLYEVNEYNVPYDIQLLIKNNESGMVLLRLVEVLGEDGLNDVGTETLYFITSALNQLNIDPLRNKILLKILPLKV